MTCKATEFHNYHPAPEDAATIAARALSVRMTCLTSEASHMGYAKLAQDTGDPAVIATIDALLDALAAARAAVQAYVRVRP